MEELFKTAEQSKSPLDILLEATEDAQHGAIRKAWHEHVGSDPESISAQWALIHFSLVAGMGENITRSAILYAKLREAREQLERSSAKMTTEFRVEDSRTAAKMADYLKVIEEGNGVCRTRIEELERATEAVRKVGSDATERMREMQKSVESHFSWLHLILLLLAFLAGAAIVWLYK